MSLHWQQEKSRWLRWTSPSVHSGYERWRDFAYKLCHMRHSQPWVTPLSHCSSESSKVKAKVTLCGQVCLTRNYSLQDMITVVNATRPASSQLQVSWATSRKTSIVKSGKEARTWLPGSSSNPQSESLSSVAWLRSSMCWTLPLTQREKLTAGTEAGDANHSTYL